MKWIVKSNFKDRGELQKGGRENRIVTRCFFLVSAGSLFWGRAGLLSPDPWLDNNYL